MPVVGSGSLFLRGQEDNKSIAFEVFGNVTGSNITLHELSNLADLTGSNQGMSEFYGYQNQAPPETVTTDAVSNVSSTQGRFNGTVSVASGGVTSRGFKWMSGNQSTSTLISSGTEQTAGSGVGSFNYTKTGLSNSTGYSYIAWAENEAGRTYASSRVYFVTLARYTYTFTVNSNVSSPLDPANLSGTKSSTVDAGSTATVNYSVNSRIAECFTNSAGGFNTPQIQGQYSSIGCTGNGQTWGFCFRKTGMNANASGCYNGFISGANTTFWADPVCSNLTMGVSTYNSNVVCGCYCGWSPSSKDPRDTNRFWFNRNAGSFSWSGHYADQSLGSNKIETWQVQCTGTSSGAPATSYNKYLNSGQSVIAAESGQYGNKSGFSIRGPEFGPVTAPSDIRLKNNINYL